ncbi:MAG: hypothetical protein JNJ80_20560 [Gemmatimonadetes bacterium]|nr:hypothetical protein [Gemmatimonadota bacterium]
MTIPPELEPSIPSWARMGDKRRDHVRRVAELVHRWAVAMDLPAGERSRWLRAVWLHDALRDADPAELAAWAPGMAGPEELLHGPAAARRAEAEGLTDRGILEAVRHHSVGAPDFDAVGRALYCADFLEPGRRFDQAERAELAERFPKDPDQVFREVVTRRLLFLVRSGWPLPDGTARLWNALVASSSR